MSNLVECKECGHEVSKKAKTCPNCGVDKPAVKPPSAGETITSYIVFAIIIGAVYYYWPRETPEERETRLAAEAQQAAADKEAGFHCLSAWDGSHSGVVSFVKERLRDPDSFDHVETRITPVDANGEHQLIMQYRANNGFGGVTVGTATAVIKNEGCGGSVTSIE